jgi:hypothetical protein
MRVVITTYTFDASAKTVDFSGYSNFDEQRLQAIVNITRGAVIYAPGLSGKGLTSIAGDVLTLEYDTTAHADADKLMPIYIEAPTSTGLATSAKQDTIISHLADLKLYTDTLEALITSTNGYVDNLESLITTLNGYVDGVEAKLDSLIAKDFATETTLASVLAKIIAAPATEAKQDTQQTTLAAIRTAVEIIDNFISAGKGLVTEDNSAAIKTAVETIDNFISGSRGLVTEDNSAAIKTAVEVIDNFISGSRGLVTEDNSAAIKTAVEALDNMISGNYGQVKAFADTSGSGGQSISRVISAASTNATSAKGSAGKVYTIIATNINAAVRYLKLYNKASSPTVGTDTPVFTIAIPGNTAGAGIVISFGDTGVNFATGIAYAITTGVADADTGAVAANEIVVQVLYA